jgi:hypothetical protein
MWRPPVLAAGVTLVGVILLLAVLVKTTLAPDTRPKLSAAIGQHIDAGRQALAAGRFTTAVQEFDAAMALSDRVPEPLAASERRQVVQLQRQAALVNDLLAESLDDILRHAVELSERDEAEWQAVFDRRYQGKALIFDADVRWEPPGRWLLEYAIFVRGRLVPIDLSDLTLLQDLYRHQLLSQQKPQRLLLGVRLASVRLEPGGIWVIRFQPDSGVLLTDARAAAFWYAHPLREIQEALDRQLAWVNDLP